MAFGVQRAMADRLEEVIWMMRNERIDEKTPAYRLWECNPFRDPEEYR